MTQPLIIQGGMGAGVSDWRLARAVSQTGQLGVVSGTALAVILVRRLQVGDLYGQMPKTWLDSDDDSGHGRFIPTTSVDQYAATLAQWFGVPPASLSAILPNAGNFQQLNLGFLG